MYRLHDEVRNSARWGGSRDRRRIDDVAAADWDATTRATARAKATSGADGEAGATGATTDVNASDRSDGPGGDAGESSDNAVATRRQRAIDGDILLDEFGHLIEQPTAAE